MAVLQGLQTDVTVFEFLQETPLHNLPSPTLTNPDLVLPDFTTIPYTPSPPQSRGRPPSPNCFRDGASNTPDARHLGGSRINLASKDKRGLMSRKMMLLRTRTASDSTIKDHLRKSSIPRSVPSEQTSDEDEPPLASSPTLHDVGSLAPAQPDHNRHSTSGSSLNSDEYIGMANLLAKYEARAKAEAGAGASSDDGSEGDSLAQKSNRHSVSVSVIEGGIHAQHKQQEEDEQASAILSQRAEQILANAKRRLNLMEGNLRGARDLVAPLTMANLKRATSLGSAHHSPHLVKTRYLLDGYANEPESQLPPRLLHAQASSPTIGRDFHGHARNFSETELPERSHAGLRKSVIFSRPGRLPVKVEDRSFTPVLRGSKSYDSIGMSAPLDRPLHARGSPDSNLEPLPEADDDKSGHALSAGHSSTPDFANNGLGTSRRSPSTPDDLRTQMSSLRGKISTLKERAREDSLRRQSLQTLKPPSSFTNATVEAPEFFYNSTQTDDKPSLHAASVGPDWTPQDSSSITPHSMHTNWIQSQAVAGSRNAFAEQAAQSQQQRFGQTSPQRTPSAEVQRQPPSESSSQSQLLHRRTPSGTAIIGPAANRYSHHLYNSSADMPRPYVENDSSEEPSSSDDSGPLPRSSTGASSPRQFDDTCSEDGASLYEDAQDDQPNPAVVAHEDRDDAFDYEHFFLHSAMGSYSNDRRNSISSNDTASSTETARGPAAIANAEDDEPYDDFTSLPRSFPPASPETPERLRRIEQNLHQRNFSGESISTLATFATANESPNSPVPYRQGSAMDWPIRSLNNSRPSTALDHLPTTAKRSGSSQRDSDSDRADSGVGLPRRAHSSQDTRRPPMLKPKSAPSALASPPTSPPFPVLQDPTTIAVHALLAPGGRPLGLKDKALLFGLVESLRKVTGRVQRADDDGPHDSYVVRRRLEDAKRVLDGMLDPHGGLFREPTVL